MKKFLIILFMSLITGSSYYGLVTKKQEQSKDFQNTVQETVQENVVQNEISEEIQENAVSEVENIVEPEEITQNTIKKHDHKHCKIKEFTGTFVCLLITAKFLNNNLSFAI